MEKEYNIYVTEEFERDFKKLDNSIKIQIDKEISQLKVNPFVGKPLGYEFFREKKVKNHRFYYLIYEEHVIVFVVALSDKKNQQQVIDNIKSLIPFYKEEIKKKLNNP
ncbi:MAG: type II toxin-antitoxin system RelE/ParE family toxin [Nanoarchaeota archaeon]|nr:type II toxin-antitoxin system RelE/ParE family toxin [Nanoarchaeota archaeon]